MTAYKYSVSERQNRATFWTSPTRMASTSRPVRATPPRHIDIGRLRMAATTAGSSGATNHLPYSSPVNIYEVPSRLVEDGTRTATSIPTASWRTSSIPYVKEDGLHAYRVHAADRVPVRRLVGLSGHRATLPLPARYGTPQDLMYFDRQGASGRAWRHHGLGAGSFSEGWLRSGRV